MQFMRNILHGNRGLAALLLAAALLLKLLVPAGYMASASRDLVITVSICADSTGERLSRQLRVPMRSDGAGTHEPGGAAKAEGECPFAVLAMGALGSVDIALLAAAIAFALLRGFAPVCPPRISRTPHARPPLRGPPLAA